MEVNAARIYLKIGESAAQFTNIHHSSTSGSQICRFCLKNSEKFIDLFEDKNGTEVMLFLGRYCDFTIDFDDSWPRSACLVCVEKIENFRRLCDTIRENENILRKNLEAEIKDAELFFPPTQLEIKTEDTHPDSETEMSREENQDDQMISEFFSLTCDLCKIPFKRASDLRLHFRRQHKRRWYIVCCSVKHRQKGSIMEHLIYHTNPNQFKCPHCRRQFMTQTAVTNHIENRHNPEKRILECGHCEKIFAIKSILKLHIRKQHQGSKKKSPTKTTQPSTEGKPMNCMCEVCGRIFSQTKSLQRHAKSHAPPQNPDVTQPVVRRFKCSQCGCAYKQRQALRAHEKKHNAYGTYRCEHCGKVSPTPTALQKHIKDSHTLQRDFVCHICQRGFKRKAVLKEHIAIHTGEYLYACDFCPKQFRAGANKSLHMRREHPEHRTAGRVPKL